jgi:hypothetical protein
MVTGSYESPTLKGSTHESGTGSIIGVAVGVGINVGVAVGRGVGVLVAVGMGVGVGTDVGVGIGVTVGAGVNVGVGLAVGDKVGVGPVREVGVEAAQPLLSVARRRSGNRIKRCPFMFIVTYLTARRSQWSEGVA